MDENDMRSSAKGSQMNKKTFGFDSPKVRGRGVDATGGSMTDNLTNSQFEDSRARAGRPANYQQSFERTGENQLQDSQAGHRVQ